MSKISAIIPARMAATRFPGKPLFPLLGLPMIEHIRRRVSMCKILDEVVVATCDPEIRDAVERHGGKVIMTANTHVRCTDRIAEAASFLSQADIVINVQGDEPLVMPEMMEAVVKPLLEDPDLPCANLVTPVADDEEFANPNAPKVVVNRQGDILYISREPIPSRRKSSTNNYRKLKQLGIIAFTGPFLHTFTSLEPTPLEIVESVDMMRAIEHGYRVRAVEIAGTMIGVDVPGDAPRVEKILREDSLARRYLK